MWFTWDTKTSNTCLHLLIISSFYLSFTSIFLPTTTPKYLERQTMRGPYAALLLLLGLLLLLLCTTTSICFGLHLRNSEVRCIEEERQALLKFKQGLEDDEGMLSSWGILEEDCCNWKGIKCSNRTSHVFKLDLWGDWYSEPPKYLHGEINSSLLGLQHLTYLDLSCNTFSILPEFIGSLTINTPFQHTAIERRSIAMIDRFLRMYELI
jgi:hypothetical protein